MSAARVDAVIATVGRHDAALANWMRVAADGLMAGEGEELITQAGLQRYLWYDLPRRHPDDTWRQVADATAVLLALLDLDRYAAIARSETTAARPSATPSSGSSVRSSWRRAGGRLHRRDVSE